MYSTLLILHAVVRWLVVISLTTALGRSIYGYLNQRSFTRVDHILRHWTATFAHIQLVMGVMLYMKSPLVQYFWKNFSEAMQQLDLLFYALIHSLTMLIGIVVLTIGSALAKRKQTDREQFKTMGLWFGMAFILFLVAIPWPFSFFAQRPFIRLF
ncbi:hypothetical protein H4K35_05515 [Myroides sp. NP-2]|uniref:hypothetical protein n=1 Tax=Myroides sp. NP-2 TaxID=2759945 RepID=UPI0015FBBE91|nr:hypothetical protein [Myroides sp. NP-2]MBB1149595.1 hypothetical protein [Myroides sp. NP-2]